jgi:large subunit ribosomal protein L29
MNVKDLRELTEVELGERERQLHQEIFNLRFQLSTGRLENTMKVRYARRDLARLKTIANELKAKNLQTIGKAKENV